MVQLLHDPAFCDIHTFILNDVVAERQGLNRAHLFSRPREPAGKRVNRGITGSDPVPFLRKVRPSNFAHT